jgi:hypothetical protein
MIPSDKLSGIARYHQVLSGIAPVEEKRNIIQISLFMNFFI